MLAFERSFWDALKLLEEHDELLEAALRKSAALQSAVAAMAASTSVSVMPLPPQRASKDSDASRPGC